MDGPMRPYLPELTIRDYNIYQWYLRGVQYQLNTTYGLYSCSLLQHNGVLFALLSDSLAGREATCKKVRLPWTLCWRPMMCQTQGIRLAAQVEVLLGWHKLQDRRCDELPFQQRVKRTMTASCSAAPMKRPCRRTPRWSGCLNRSRSRRSFR